MNRIVVFTPARIPQSRQSRFFGMTIFFFVILAVVLPLGAQEAPTADPVVAALLEDISRRVTAGETGAVIEELETFVSRAAEGGEPVAPQIRAVLGGLHLQRGNPERAYQLLIPLVEESPDAALLYNAARAASAVGNEEEAVVLLERSAQLSPVSPAARALGLMRAQQGRAAEAYWLLRPWAIEYPEDVQARLAASYLALDLGRTDDAEQLLSDLPQDEPRVRLLLARLLLEQENPRAAISTLSPLQAAISRGETGLAGELQLDVRRLLAEAYLQTDAPERALEQLQGVPVRDLQTALLLARGRIHTGDHTSAEEALRPYIDALLAQDLDELPAAELELLRDLAFEYGRAALATGDAKRAVEAFRVAVDLEPWNPVTPELLSQALSETGAEDEAAEAAALSQRLQAQQSQQRELFNVGDTGADSTARAVRMAQRWLLHDRPARALELARDEMVLSPYDLRPRFIEVQALLQLKRPEDALAAADRTLQLAPENADALYQKGLVLMVQGETERAEELMRRAIERSPDHTAAMNDLALLLLERGETDEARAVLEKILLLQPSDPQALATLERIGKS